MSTQVDIAIIGAGPGGTPAAMQLDSQGKTVLLVEASGKPGGACLFFGCIPSKIIRHQAETVAIERSHKGKDAWFQEDRQEAWDRARAIMDTILEKCSGGAIQMLKQMPNLTLLAGQASFISANELQIREKKTGDKKNYTFDKALIATGKIPNIEPLGLDTLGITCDNKGIQVNDFMETSVSSIYAVVM